MPSGYNLQPLREEYGGGGHSQRHNCQTFYAEQNGYLKVLIIFVWN